jgi:hypothetical protein
MSPGQRCDEILRIIDGALSEPARSPALPNPACAASGKTRSPRRIPLPSPRVGRCPGEVPRWLPAIGSLPFEGGRAPSPPAPTR